LLCLFPTGQKIRIVLKITASGNGRLFTFRYRGLGIWGVTKVEKGVFLVVARRPCFFFSKHILKVLQARKFYSKQVILYS
jgi:hypothetical protein